MRGGKCVLFQKQICCETQGWSPSIMTLLLITSQWFLKLSADRMVVSFLLAINRNRSAVKTTPSQPRGVWDMQRGNEGKGAEMWGGGQRNSGMQTLLPPLASSQPSPPLLYSVRKPPAVLSGNQISHLESACCAGMSRAHYPAHYTPLLFPNTNTISPMSICLSLPLFFPRTLTHSVSSSLSCQFFYLALPPPSTQCPPVDH